MSIPVDMLDPELRAPALRLQEQMRGFRLDAQSLPIMRNLPWSDRPLLDHPKTSQHVIPSAHGVRIAVVGCGDAAMPKPIALYLHGGGFVLGSAFNDLRRLQEMSLALDCIVVSVDYRLAPETIFPGALEDNLAALRWVHSHAKELGGDPCRIALIGESAGGGHAAMLAMAARNYTDTPLVLQVLLQPMLDDRTGSSREVPHPQGAIVWGAEQNRFGWSSLLGVPAGSVDVPAGSVPAREPDLSRLPPTFMGVGSLDLFLHEDICFAQRLIDSGVSTQLLVVPGAFHGFDMFASEAAVSRRFTEAWMGAMRRAFQAPS